MSTALRALGLSVERRRPGVNSGRRYYNALTQKSRLPSHVSPLSRAEIVAARQRRAAEMANAPAEEAAERRRRERDAQEAMNHQRELARQVREQAELDAQRQHDRDMALIEAQTRATEADAQSRAARSHTAAPSMRAPSSYHPEYPPPPSQNFGYGGYPGMPVIFNNANGSGPGHCGCGPFGHGGHQHGPPHQPHGNPSNPHNYNAYSGGHQQRQQSPQPGRSPSPRRGRSRQRGSSPSPSGAAQLSTNNMWSSLMELLSGGGNGNLQVTPIFTSTSRASSKSNGPRRTASPARHPPQPTVEDDDYDADYESDSGARTRYRSRSRSRSQTTRTTGSVASQNRSQKLLEWPTAPQSKQASRTLSPAPSLLRSAMPVERNVAITPRTSAIPQSQADMYLKYAGEYGAASEYTSDTRYDSVVEDREYYDFIHRGPEGKPGTRRNHGQARGAYYEDSQSTDSRRSGAPRY